jgi:hypothetical protein
MGQRPTALGTFRGATTSRQHPDPIKEDWMARREKPTSPIAEPEPTTSPDRRATPDDPRREARSPQKVAPSSPLEQEIRLRAYYRYMEREGAGGDEMSDWLEAESDVLGRHAMGIDVEEKVSDKGTG